MRGRKGPKPLLFISEDPQDLIFGKEIADVCGLEFCPTVDPEEWIDIVDRDEPPAIFVDASSELQYLAFESKIHEKLGIFSEKIDANRLHFISPEGLDKAIYLVRSPLVGHFVFRNYIDPKMAGNHYSRIVKATMPVENETVHKAFGLAGLMKAGAKIQTIKLSVSNQKNDAVEAVKAFATAVKFQDRASAIVANGVDELLMNAIFDAPVDDSGKNLHSRVARSTVLQLFEKSAVELHLGFDGEYIAISVTDNYGSLDRNSLMGAISKVYVEEKYQVRSSVANAGLGLATIFQSGGSFLFVSDRAKRTEATLFFRRTHNFREFKDQFRFLSTQFYV